MFSQTIERRKRQSADRQNDRSTRTVSGRRGLDRLHPRQKCL